MKDQADSLIKLGKLLKKKRDKDIKDRVDKLVDSDLTNEEKIERIENLDKIALETKTKKQTQKKEAQKQKRKDIIKKSKNVINKLKKPTIDFTHGVKKILPSKFFNFIINEHSKIKHFSLATKTLKAKFPFKFEISDQSKQTLNQKIWDAIYIVYKPVKYAIREGWKRLTKFQYNLCVNFLIFCEDYYRIDFRNASLEDFNKSTPLLNIQHFYLQSAQNTKHRMNLYKALELMCLSHEIYKKDIDNILTAARIILEPDLIKPGLLNVFLAVNMSYYKKYINFDTLIESKNVKQINENNFECSPEIKFKITGFVSDLKIRIEKLEKELRLINLLKTSFSNSINENRTESNILKNVFLYNLEQIGKNDKFSFDDYKRDLLSFMNKLLSNFFLIFDPLFTDSLKILDNNEIKTVKILSNEITNNQVHYLRLSSDRINRFISGHLNTKIYFSDYDEFLVSGKTPYENELEFFRLCFDSANSFFEMGKELVYLLDDNLAATHIESLKKTMPYKDKIVLENSFVDNQTVYSYITKLTEFCFAYSNFYKNSKQQIIIDSELKIINEIATIKETIERLS